MIVICCPWCPFGVPEVGPKLETTESPDGWTVSITRPLYELVIFRHMAEEHPDRVAELGLTEERVIEDARRAVGAVLNRLTTQLWKDPHSR